MCHSFPTSLNSVCLLLIYLISSFCVYNYLSTFCSQCVSSNFLKFLKNRPTINNGPTWGELAVSAIKRRQQLTGFDCGVACLLYAEKCGMGMDRLYIARSTSQRHITGYRSLLQQLMDTLNPSGWGRRDSFVRVIRNWDMKNEWWNDESV